MSTLDLAGNLLSPPARRVIVEELVKRGAVTPAELIRALGKSKSSVVFHVQTLIESGFVQPVYKPTDGRVELFYTATDALKQALREIGEWVERMLKGLEGGGA